MNPITTYQKSSPPPAVISSSQLMGTLDVTTFNGNPCPLNAFCVTLYNEDRDSFQTTLAALFRSLLHFYEHNCRQDISTICIVADGHDRIDPKVLELLYSSGLICDETAKEYCDGVQAHSTLHNLQSIFDFFNGSIAEPVDSDLQQVQITVLLKQSNQGKLHSHFLFFNYYCHECDPVYCFQIDVGTNLAKDTVLHLIRYMEQQPKLAAIAPRIMPAMPTLSDGFLMGWQYMDFAYRKAVSWPFEVLAGYLSVIPGQAGIFRWEALHTADVENAHQVSVKEPLSEYFRGMQASNPIERIMYLAEDRIIGAAIVLSQDKAWQLGYQPEATATTDSCQSLKELCRQRRRWTNSSLACRYWLFAQLKSFLSRDDRSSLMKLEFATSTVAQFVLALREFFAPAQLAALIFVVIGAMSYTNNSLDSLLQHIFWYALAAELGLTITSVTRMKWIKTPFFGFVRATVGLVTGGLLFAILFLKLSAMSFMILLSPAIAIFAMAIVLPQSIIPLAIRGHLFPFSNLIMFCTLLCYSIWNLHDVSWGTKGLTSSVQTQSSRRETRRLRNLVFATFIILNCGIAALAISGSALVSPSLNALTEISSILEAAIALVAIAYVVVRRCKPLKKTSSSSSLTISSPTLTTVASTPGVCSSINSRA